MSNKEVKERIRREEKEQLERLDSKKHLFEVKTGRPPSPIRHGTPNGYARERALGMPTCKACREASRTKNYKSKGYKPKNPYAKTQDDENFLLSDIKHGTVAGLSKEKRLGLIPCEACKKAGAKYEREYYAKNKEKVKEQRRKRYRINNPKVIKPISHGTIGGYRTEKNRGLENCKECLEANRVYQKNYRNKLKNKINKDRRERYASKSNAGE